MDGQFHTIDIITKGAANQLLTCFY